MRKPVLPRGFKFEPRMHVYALKGRIVPNITQVIRPLLPTSFFTEAGRQEGLAMHKLIAGALKSKRAPRPMGAPITWIGEVYSIRQWLRNFDVRGMWIEQPLVSEADGFAGTPDLILEGRRPDGGGLCMILELKRGASLPAHALQTGAQELLARACGLSGPFRRGVLHPHGDGKIATVTWHTESSDSTVFRSALNLFHWRTRHNV